MSLEKVLRKKIAIIAGQLVVGGAERQLYLWLSNLDRTNYDILLLTLHPNKDDFWESPITELGIRIIEIPHYKNRVLRLHHILRILRSYQPDLIHGWHLFVSPYVGFVGKKLKIPTIGSLRDSIKIFIKNPISAILSLLTLDILLTNSVTAKNELKKVKVRRKLSIVSVQNALVLNKQPAYSLNEFCKNYHVNKDFVWIGSVGRLDPKKRFDLLIKTLARINEKTTNYHFILVGDGQDRERLFHLTTKFQLSKFVTFTGEIPNATRLMPLFDIFAFPSMDEGMPNVILEAAAARLPIVTWDLPFYREILTNGENAILVEPGNLEQFGVALQELIDNLDLRLRLGSAARQHVLDTFTIEKYTRNMTQVYDMLLTEKGNPN